MGGAVRQHGSPTLMISRPEDGHSYALGREDVTTRGVCTCADEAGGTGLVSCVGDVPFDTQLNTSTAGTNISFTVTATDGAGNSATAVSHYDILAGNLPGRTGANLGRRLHHGPRQPRSRRRCRSDPRSNVPAWTLRGHAGSELDPITLPPPSGYTFFGQQVNISSTTTGIAFDHPLVITFTNRGREPGADPSTLTVVRTEAGVPTTLGLCTGAAGTASPELPCMTAPVRITSGPAAGDIQVSVYTTHASSWNVGTHAPFAYQGFLQPVDNPPTVNSSKAGSAIPVKFSLGSNRGLG